MKKIPAKPIVLGLLIASIAAFIGFTGGSISWGGALAQTTGGTAPATPTPVITPVSAGRQSVGVASFQMTYQGLLTSPTNGSPVGDATRTVKFRLYSAESGSSPAIWEETKQVTTSKGTFTIVLGDQTPLTPTLIAVGQLWLGIQIPPDAEMTPRQRVTGSIYALGAKEAGVSDVSSVNAQQIALRRWYQVDRVRGPRVDLDFSADDLFEPATPIHHEVTALTATTAGFISYSYGPYVGTSSAPVSNRAIDSNTFKSIGSCLSLRPLETKYVCAQDSKLLITLISTGGGENERPPEEVACASCTRTVFDGRYIWAASRTANQVVRIDLNRVYQADLVGAPGTAIYPSPSAPAVVANYVVGNQPSGIEFDRSNIWVANEADDTVTVLNGQTGGVITTMSVGDKPTELLFDGVNLWVLNSGDATVSQVNTLTRLIVGTYATGKAPKALSFDGGSLWIANSGDNTITRLRGSDGSLIETILLPGAPFYLQFDGIGTWIATKEVQPDMKSKKNIITGERWFITRY